MAITEQTLTLEEFLKLPQEEPALEYWDGVVIQKVSPKILHGWLQFVLAELLNNFARPRGLGLAFPETRATFAGRSPVPDVVFYLWERIPFRPDGQFENDFSEPPDIAIEILSPEQRRSTLVKKCGWFVEHGVRIALLIDPEERSVLLFRHGAQLLALEGPDRIDLDDVLPGFELTVEALFRTLYPTRTRSAEAPAS